MSLFGENFMQIKIVLLITKLIGFIMNMLVVAASFLMGYILSKNIGVDNIDTLGPYAVFTLISFLTS